MQQSNRLSPLPIAPLWPFPVRWNPSSHHHRFRVQLILYNIIGGARYKWSLNYQFFKGSFQKQYATIKQALTIARRPPGPIPVQWNPLSHHHRCMKRLILYHIINGVSYKWSLADVFLKGRFPNNTQQSNRLKNMQQADYFTLCHYQCPPHHLHHPCSDHNFHLNHYSLPCHGPIIVNSLPSSLADSCRPVVHQPLNKTDQCRVMYLFLWKYQQGKQDNGCLLLLWWFWWFYDLWITTHSWC
jgi:hypothetical protein